MSSERIPVPIANSELRRLTASHSGQEYEIKVRLPERYDETNESYPVLYLLDGDHAFAMATDIVQYLVYGDIPDLIIVSPAYGCKDDPEHGGTNMRNRDLLPFLTPWSDEPPDAAGFLQFIEQQLIPFVSAEYRVDEGGRTLAGYSSGALFVLYTLFQKPALFQRLIAIDGLAPRILEMEEAFAAANSALPARLFLAFGHDDFSDFASKMVEREYAGFTVEYAQLSREGHFMVPAEGLTKGLVSVFQG